MSSWAVRQISGAADVLPYSTAYWSLGREREKLFCIVLFAAF